MESRTAPNLLQQLSEEFHGDTLSRIATAIGETPAKTANALRAALPALLAGIAGKASSTAGAGELLDTIHTNKLDTTQYASAASSLAAPDGINTLTSTGQTLGSTVLGSRAGAVTDWLATQAGISRGSSRSLMSLVLPIVLALIGRRVVGTGGGVAGLMALMRGQNFLRDAPAGLDSALGMDEPIGARRRPEEPMRPGVVYTTEERHRSSWLRWALPLALLAGLVWFLSGRTARREVTVELPETPVPTTPAPMTPAPMTPAPTTPMPAAPAMPRADLGTMVDKTLPNGTTLKIPARGVESQLLVLIEDPSQTISEDRWFSFDRLEFETGSNQLAASSQEQLKNIAEIMKAYPDVSVKVGGYTDNVGDAAANKTLSQERAMNTMNALATLGVDKARMEAEGYGAEHPVADNSTDEGRQRNRRIDIRVTKK